MTLRFSSSPLVYAPGFIAAMRRVGHLTEEATDKAASLYMLAQSFPQAPAWALLALVEGRYTVEGDAVVVSDEPVTIDGIDATGTEQTVGGAL
jgi:hypothetical protein